MMVALPEKHLNISMVTTTRKPSNRKKCYCIAMKSFALISALLAFCAIASNVRTPIHRSVTSIRGKKPIMYTFYNKIDAEDKNTGMTDDADEVLLKVWEEEWNKAGWETRILNLNDARGHPRFAEFEEKLQEIHLNGANTVYNQFCYYRWLAMATVGGGFMSDFDVFPMNTSPEDFKDGTFSIYESTPDNNGGIPCLMSGSGTEWERMAFNVVQNGAEHVEEDFWSDMYASIDIYQKHPDAYILYSRMANAQLTIEEWNPDLCKIAEDRFAVHFSHNTMHKLHVKNIDFNQRPQVARDFLNRWKSACKLSIE